jgi:hypothetical protein
MSSYTDIGRVPGAWRDSGIASRASAAIAATGSYNPSSPSPSYTPSNASGSVDVFVTSSNRSSYESLRAESARISSGLANGTATRAEVISYNERAKALGNGG